MALAGIGTPALVVAALAAVVMLAPLKVTLIVAGALLVGIVVALVGHARAPQPRPLPRDERPELHAIVERLCALADLPRPRIVIDPGRQPNSWVVDAPGRRPTLHVTEPLLELLNPAELEAVVAHELAHVANHDATVMTVVGGPGTALLEGSRRFVNVWPVQLGALVATTIGLASKLGTNALSRYRELSADAGAAALTGRPSALASALLKVSGEQQRVPEADLRAAAARNAFNLLPVEPNAGGWAHRLERRALGATHPGLERRLAQLERLEQALQRARLPG